MIFNSSNFFFNGIYSKDINIHLVSEGSGVLNDYGIPFNIESENEEIVLSFCYANEDGNGHITNCIKHNDWFYFLDMMMCRNDSQEYLCPENGVLEDLLASEWAGFLYKCKNPVDFCLFHMNCCQRKNRISPFVFYLRESEYVYATGLSLKKDGNTFLVPVSEKPIILYLAEKSSAKINIIELPDVISSQIHN